MQGRRNTPMLSRFRSLLTTALSLTLLMFGVTTPGRAQSFNRYRPVTIKSCPVADSLLGPKGGDGRGEVTGRYDRDDDVSSLIGGSAFPKWSRVPLEARVTFYGRGPYPVPDPQMVIYLSGKDAYPYVDGAEPPAAIARLDDSVTLGPFTVVAGTYEGARSHALIPLSFRLAHADFLQLVKAEKIELLLGEHHFPLDPPARATLRGLYRVAACVTLD
jgi:hypothetical protein